MLPYPKVDSSLRGPGKPLDSFVPQSSLLPKCVQAAGADGETDALYVGSGALDNYIPPSHCHLQNSGVQKFLPAWIVFELFLCRVLIVSFRPVHLVPSLTEKYKILVYPY